jgi:ABC transporter substrate binding protein (PQQ-dependent alcohol dehydrogenase system)
MGWNRRELLGALLGAGAFALCRGAAAAEQRLIRVGLILPNGDPVAEAVRRGAEMGAEEARRTAELLKVRFELAAAGMTEAAGLAASSETLALVGGLDAASRAAIGEVADRHQVLFLSIPGDGAAVESGRYRFHVATSLSRRIDALVRWMIRKNGWRRWHFVLPAGEERGVYELARRALAERKGEEVGSSVFDPTRKDFRPAVEKTRPDLLFATFGGETLARLLETAPKTGIRVAGPFVPPRGVKSGIWPADWHPELVRFGAEQLNQRFRARFGQPMDGPAWAGWAAVKALAELALRNPGIPRAELPARLEALRFDGHKGNPLSFAPGDHHLRQPVHLIGMVLDEMELEE